MVAESACCPRCWRQWLREAPSAGSTNGGHEADVSAHDEKIPIPKHMKFMCTSQETPKVLVCSVSSIKRACNAHTYFCLHEV